MLRRLLRRRRRAEPLRLRPVTLGGWLAVLTAAGVGDDGDGEPPAWEAASADVEAVEAVLEEVLLNPPARYASEEARQQTAQAAFDAYAEAAARHALRAYRRIRQLERLVGHSVGGGPPRALERSLASLSGEEYAALSRLPLWEALLYLGSRALEGDLQRENRELLSLN